MESSASAAPAGTCILGMGWFPGQAGGLNRYVHELHRSLGAAGHDVRAVVVGPAPEAPESVRVGGSATQPLPARLRAFARAAAPAIEASDVVDAHFALYAAAALIGRQRRRPLVVHFHGPWAAEKRLAGAGALAAATARRVERLVYRRADRLIVLSEAFGRILVDDYGVEPDRVRCVRPGVDVGRFAPAADRRALRARLGVGAGPLVVAVRRLVPRMGLDVLLDAFARMSSREAQLAIVGDGPARADLQASIERQGLAGRVRLVGRVPDAELPSWYASADVAVVPSLALEGFGLIMLEALASGTPVVASEVGGMAELLPRLAPDLLVAPGDADALAHRLDAALQGSAPLPSRSRCRAFAETHDWSSTARQVADVYDEARAAFHGDSASARGEGLVPYPDDELRSEVLPGARS